MDADIEVRRSMPHPLKPGRFSPAPCRSPRSRHCEERKRRSNPVLPRRFPDCFASLAMTERRSRSVVAVRPLTQHLPQIRLGGLLQGRAWHARPPRGGRFINASGASRREDANVCLDVIASAAKQSILSLCGAMDCFASLAMTARAMDCFTEPVIGRALARPVGGR